MIFKQVASRLGFTTLDWNFKLLEESWKVQQKLLKLCCVSHVALIQHYWYRVFLAPHSVCFILTAPLSSPHHFFSHVREGGLFNVKCVLKFFPNLCNSEV